MTTAAEHLARYAMALRYEDLPPRVLDRARHCLADALACAIHGQQFPWSRMVAAEARETGSGGPCRLPGAPEGTVGLHLPQAVLTLAAQAHAFELDNLRKPGAGVHGGATVALPALAQGMAIGADGRRLITAIVAGCEVMFRIGAATLHNPEKRGFHAPGITGPFGAAIACASLRGFTPEAATRALGIAGSLGGGLLAFAKAGAGGMVKRLHLGRAAEAGIVAANLAERGFEAPPTILEGRLGTLEAYCDEKDPARLTDGLGASFEIEALCIKRYACHVTAQAPVQLLRGWVEQGGFQGDDIERLTVGASAKVVSHHADPNPADLMLAQYSVPFTLAIAAYHDPSDPAVFCDAVLADERVRALAKRIEVVESKNVRGWGVEMRLQRRDGRVLENRLDSFLGCPEAPLGEADLWAKFDRLCETIPADRRRALFDALMRIEEMDDVRALPF